ncbi:MAG: NAD(P)/FAD-dependent oxidoreductase [Methanospirillum sp.]|nr:NAD(P)/FAD-dependent oxidoreductase [Methanospirillum sp.]
MIVVIGGGPAGRYAAIRLAGAGKRVRLVDRRVAGLGGQCLHQGCMTICALNDVARVIDQMRSFHILGIYDQVSGFSYPDLIRQMRETIQVIAGVIDQETRQAGVEIIQGKAELSGRNLRINNEAVTCEAVIIASGARPNIPDIPGCCLPGVHTAHTILTIPTLPQKMVIIGSGVIAAEYAYIFNSFGVQVTILARSSLLRTFPEHLVQEARRDLGEITIWEHVRVVGISGEKKAEGVIISDNDSTREIPADTVLIAAGMVPHTDFISGIDCNADGSIRVNEQMETSVQGIYAAGDVTPAPDT